MICHYAITHDPMRELMSERHAVTCDCIVARMHITQKWLNGFSLNLIRTMNH